MRRPDSFPYRVGGRGHRGHLRAAARHGRSNPAIDADVDTIAQVPQQEASALQSSELAADIRRFGEPIDARQAALCVMRKTLKRHR